MEDAFLNKLRLFYTNVTAYKKHDIILVKEESLAIIYRLSSHQKLREIECDSCRLYRDTLLCEVNGRTPYNTGTIYIDLDTNEVLEPKNILKQSVLNKKNRAVLYYNNAYIRIKVNNKVLFETECKDMTKFDYWRDYPIVGFKSLDDKLYSILNDYSIVESEEYIKSKYKVVYKSSPSDFDFYYCITGDNIVWRVNKYGKLAYNIGKQLKDVKIPVGYTRIK